MVNKDPYIKFLNKHIGICLLERAGTSIHRRWEP